jgi:HPt (histidine-containing phosphotransfer) domain-containing protein
LRHAELARTAHGLKSSSANLGAERVRNLSEHLEHCLPQSPRKHLENIIARLEKEFSLALEELEKILRPDFNPDFHK